MRRIQFYEIHEQPWCPAIIREGLTNYLQFSSNFGNYFVNIVPKLKRVFYIIGTRKIIDLCSGSGGPWFRLHHQINQMNHRQIDIILTDKYPNISTIKDKNIEGLSSGQLRYFSLPVDAREVPESLEGFRTMFLSFHHFPIKSARTILQDAVNKNQGIGIFEITERRLITLLIMLMGPIHVLFTTFFTRPLRWGYIFWTFVVPVIPMVVMFDGIVSCFRSYSIKELQGLTSSLVGSNHAWEIGFASIPFNMLRVTYAIGYPKNE